MSVRLSVHVTPKSSRDEIVGWRGGELRLKVTAPPEDGKANAAVCKLLAKSLGVAKSSVQVVRGETARHKQVEVDGIEEQALHVKFGRLRVDHLQHPRYHRLYATVVASAYV